jgi:spermidine/putrescine transport system substrate-binding protein
VGSRYSIPYSVFSTGVGFRNDLVPEADQPANLDNPYDIFWNPEFKGKISVYDDWGTTMSMAMLRDGFTDINNAGQEEIDAARDALIDMVDKTNAAFTINGTYEDLPKGIFSATEAWSGDMTSAPYYGKENAAATAPLLSFWYPEDKRGLIYWDNIVILKRGSNPVLAHTFLNYMMESDVAFKNMGWVGYQHPQNDMVPSYFKDRSNKWSWIVYPNLINTIAEPGDIDKGYIFVEQPPEVDAMWKAAWDQVQAG